MASKPTVLSLLGGFLLTVDGERREVPARKVKALMCRLAVDDAPVEALESAMALTGDDHRYQADAWLQLGNALFPQGLTTGCLRAHQTALEHAERAGCTRGQARAATGLGIALRLLEG